MASDETGPGVLSTDGVGLQSIAKTTLIDTRYAMAYAAAVNDANPAYFIGVPLQFVTHAYNSRLNMSQQNGACC